MMEAGERPIGRHRGIGFVILMMIITLGIYGLYWIFITFTELRAHRGTGVSGIVGMLLAFIPVSIFLLPSYVGNAYAEAGKPKPITGLTGLWALVPLVGSLVWVFRVQGSLNRYWGGADEASELTAATPAEPVAPTEPVTQAEPAAAVEAAEPSQPVTPDTPGEES
jgi:hypothetical protein